MARVSEAVNSGEDLVLEEDQDDQEEQLDKQEEKEKEEQEEQEEQEEEKKSSSGQDMNILSSRLDKTEQSLDSLGSHQLLHSDLLIYVEILEY